MRYMRNHVCLTLLSLFMVAATASCAVLFPDTIFAQENMTILTGKVVATVSRAVPMPFNSIVEEILVQPGDAVQNGSPLLVYRLQDEAERLLQREVNMGAGMEGLKGQVLDMQGQLAELSAERNKTSRLVASGLGSRQALTRLEDSVASTKSRIELTKSTIRKNENNFQARLKELSGYFDQPIKEGETLPEKLVLKSPIQGYVLALMSALNPGQLLAAGSTPVQVGQLNPVLIQVPVYEAEINSIKVGDTAEVEIPSLDSKTFKGIVSEISWISTDMNVVNPSYYTVELTVPNPELTLKPGFKAIVRFGSDQ